MKLSVIIPCYEHSTELKLCLDGLTRQEPGFSFETIVVDSAMDPRVLAVTQAFARVRLVRSETRLFPGAARNLGVRHASGECLAFLDADCIPSGAWARTAFASLDAGHALVGGPVLDVPPVRAIAWVDNRLQFADFQGGRPAGPGSHFPSCNLAIRREAFAALGGFREDVVTGEDAVLSQRARQVMPQAMWYQPGMAVFHQGRPALRGMLEHQRLLGYYRGRLGLAMTPAWDWLARSPWFGGLAALRRLAYVTWRTWQYDRPGLPRLILTSPLLLAGLAAWTLGFYGGIRDRNRRET